MLVRDEDHNGQYIGELSKTDCTVSAIWYDNAAICSDDEFIKQQIDDKAEMVENRLASACESFRSGIAFHMINDVAMQRRSFKPDERDVISHDVNLYFSNQIAELRLEGGKLGHQDIMLIFCTVLGIDQDVVADIMCTSRSNMRSIKSRLKSKISAESFSLYFKE